MGRDFEGYTNVLALDGLERVTRALVAGAGERAGHEGHVLAHRDVGLLVVQREQRRRRQDIGVCFRFQGVEDHRHGEVVVQGAPTQRQPRRLGQRAGEIGHLEIAAVIVIVAAGQYRLSNSPGPLVRGVDIAAVETVILGEQPLQAEVLCVVDLHLHDDRLHQYLGAADVQPVDHGFDGGHLIRVGGDDKRVGALVRLDGGFALARHRLLAGLGVLQLADTLHHPGQHLGDIGGVGVLEVNHLDVAALLQRRVQVLDQLAHARALDLIAIDQHAVGAGIGHQEQFRLAALLRLRLGQLLQHAHHVLGHGKAQAHDLGLLHGGAVHALDHVADALDIRRDIGNDDRVTGRVGRHVRLLGHERTQYRNELRRGDILQADHLGDVFGIDPAAVGAGHLDRGGARVLAGDDADHAARADGGVAMHFEDRQEQVVKLGTGYRLGGHHLDLALHGGVDHDGRAGHLGDKLDQLLDIRLFQVDGVILRRHGRRSQHRREKQRQQALDGKPIADNHCLFVLVLGPAVFVAPGPAFVAPGPAFVAPGAVTDDLATAAFIVFPDPVITRRASFAPAPGYSPRLTLMDSAWLSRSISNTTSPAERMALYNVMVLAGLSRLMPFTAVTRSPGLKPSCSNCSRSLPGRTR